ncbi:hypothetical protein KC332_g2131 [Hortaea werneckii]|uniref:Uncharacterized protein n=2 Tax=Hortaea werneckii TaxID=91943 RepID=A0A3M7IG76_HORWE|nr:hypothetical protein KC358_g2282 [Hortaea werneckii]OTA33706.1 hypothetical protein BTJ68_04760 [Hortaea werneckii EXF-2000]KAI6850852.1 hypothetical protein KC350_g1923 [Hortaea werneckii]KAI6942526.1 hypothetical protein KC341_g2168 [Hortaea werneckii]KAI6944634.1 hypothetical protein KC348_g3939 [Hortaea werneckii]
MAAPLPVLYAVWQDHTREGLAAYTVTLPARYGDFLVAGLALIVTLTGEGLWKIVAYILHQVGAKGSGMDIQHLEHQVILRNQAMPFDSILEFSKIAWTWRHSRLRPLRRAFGLMFWPLIILTGFSLASVFSANVSKPAYEVNRILLESNACGLLMPSMEDQQTEKGRSETQQKYMKDMRQSRAYAEECYRSLHGSAICNDFASARLPYTTQQEVTCPFGNRCLLGRRGAVRYDTGKLNSHVHLGVNAVPADRVDFRKVTTCSVLDIQDRTQILAEEVTGQELWNRSRVFLGPIAGVSDWTLQHSDLLRRLEQPYTINSFHNSDVVSNVPATDERGNGDWLPIEDLTVEAADVSLHLVAANNVKYTDAVYDPLFSATRKASYGAYIPDDTVRALACTDQLQVCGHNSDRCTPLLGTSVLNQNLSSSYGFSGTQEATAIRIALAFHRASSYFVVTSNPSSALIASDVVIPPAQDSSSLPNDQWIDETTAWFQTGLASLQLEMVQYPNNFWSVNGSEQTGITPPDEYPRMEMRAPLSELCGRQLGTNTGSYQSFSLIGLLVIGIIAFLVFLTSLTITYWAPLFVREHKKIAYDADGKLQLLRQLLQAHGLEGWERRTLTAEVPALRESHEEATAGPAERSDDFVGYQRTVVAHIHPPKMTSD